MVADREAESVTPQPGLVEHARLSEDAPAKINLTLHVLGRRDDGYHALESLVAFADVADQLTLDPGQPFSLAVNGPTAVASGPVETNLVTLAATALALAVPGLETGAFHLAKHLPAAGGVGGGSTDAAAALRLLARLNGIPLEDPRLIRVARELGADVPVCLDPHSRMMRGGGETLGAVLKLPPLNAVLVNPGVPVETGAVFRELGFALGEMRGGAPHPDIVSGISAAELVALLGECRNDMEPAAIRAHQVIAEVLDCLRKQKGCQIARMSGSGGTCFAVFATMGEVFEAVRGVRRQHSGWWVQPSVIG